MPNVPHAPGLLGKGMVTSDGKHMYHASKDPVVVYTADQEEQARTDGYGEEYIHRDYPKVVTFERPAINGKPPQVCRATVHSEDEEKRLAGSLKEEEA